MIPLKMHLANYALRMPLTRLTYNIRNILIYRLIKVNRICLTTARDFSFLRSTKLKILIIKENRILNEDGLRYRDEFVNHKILDCIGDLMLSGHRIFGHIKTSQGGHELTNKLLREFLTNTSNWKFENFEDKNDKDTKYLKSIAVNA